MTFAEALKDARLKLGLSQTKLAKEIHVSFTTINRYENGHYMMPPPAKEALNSFFLNHIMQLQYESKADEDQR